MGSYARGDAEVNSDIDVLVITNNYISRGRLYSLFGTQPHISGLSLIAYPSATFRLLYDEGALFIAHVLREGHVMHDDGFYADLTSVPFQVSRKGLLLDWQVLKLKLELCKKLAIYGDVLTECLSHIYPALKNVAILALALGGELLFNKDKALQHFEDRFPELKDDILRLKELEPFSLAWKGAFTQEPFAPVGCTRRVNEYLQRLDKIISRVESYERNQTRIV